MLGSFPFVLLGSVAEELLGCFAPSDSTSSNLRVRVVGHSMEIERICIVRRK